MTGIVSNRWNLPDSPGINPTLEKKAGGGAIRIGDIAEKALLGLSALAMIGTTGLFVASILLNPIWATIALAVSAVALAVLVVALLLPDTFPERLVHVANTIKTVAKEIFLLLACAVLYPVSQTWFDPKKPEEIDPNQDPILMVHGYLHNSSAWIYHRYRLNKAGFKNVFTVDLGHPLHSIEDYAAKVKEKMEEIRKLTGKSNVTLVGHSMGGLVSSYYTLHQAQDQGIHVNQVITLGSPMKGTKLANIGIGECAKQMRYQSGKNKFLSELRHDMKMSAVPFFHMGSQTDEIIRPTKAAIIPSKDHFEFREMGHAAYLFSDRVSDRLVVRLAQKPVPTV